MSNQITKTYRVYGAEGHRQRVSFMESDCFRTWRGSIVDMRNAGKTGTNEYTELQITADCEEDCLDTLRGQVSDGIFENSRTGKILDAETGEELQLWS